MLPLGGSSGTGSRSRTPHGGTLLAGCTDALIGVAGVIARCTGLRRVVLRGYPVKSEVRRDCCGDWNAAAGLRRDAAGAALAVVSQGHSKDTALS